MRPYYEKDMRKYNELSYEGKYLVDPKYMTKRDLQHFYRYYNMTKNRTQFKKIVVLVLCIGFFSYIFVDYNLRTKLIHLKNKFDSVERVDADYNVSQSYFVDTRGCRMPFFDVTNDNIIQYQYKPRNYKCQKALTRTSDVGATIVLNMNAQELQEYYNISDLKNIKCTYRGIQRKSDDSNSYMDPVGFDFVDQHVIQVNAGIEFVRVDCRDLEDHTFYKDFHFFILDKSKSAVGGNTTKAEAFVGNELDGNLGHEDQTLRRTPFQKHRSVQQTTLNETGERVSVMILGIDSVSHLNFLRQMHDTTAYIHQNLSYAEFWGYNKVGDNTYPNLIPMLSGLDETELNMACLSTAKKTFYDRCPFIWKRFKDVGYKTVYAEDVAQMGLFNFFRAGFRKQPTDYYLRTIMREMESYISYKKKLNVELCKGGRRTADVVLEMIRKLIPYMQSQDFFSFFWTVTLTHDYLNMPILLDSDIVKLFEAFETAGIFNKTVIFLVSDHGIRWGSFRKTYQGMMEERLPLLIALYPKWFKKRYPEAIKNLEVNSKRLTTHYDLHATLLDLVNLQNLQADRIAKRSADLLDTDTLPRSISLFLPIPETRSCETAGIASHWCTCHQRQELPTNDARVQKAARYIVKLINDRLKAHPQCRTLYLNSIKEAIYAAPNLKIVRDVTNDYSIDITVQLQTKPGMGLFESTVRMSSYSITLTGTISRINLYRSQSYCMDDYSLKMFCYCHR